MNTPATYVVRLGAILVFCGMLLLGLPAPATPVAAQTNVPPSGIVCTTSPTGEFTLYARAGYISMADGNLVYTWSFSPNSEFQYPGPALCVNENDQVTVTLVNELREPVSLIFPGQQNVTLGDGTPLQPVFNGGGSLVSLVQTAAANGGSVTYRFIAGEPGTYAYQSGANMGVQTRMGLVGALIVRPASGATYAYNRADTTFKPGHEYLVLLTEIDPLLHQSVERNRSYDMSKYRPRYWLINGRSFPDTLAPNGAAWLPSQPYGALAHIEPYHPTSNPLPMLVRYVGFGVEDYPFHPHGNHGRVIARDGRLLADLNGQDLSGEEFTVMVGPGQTVDALFDWRDAEGFDPDSKQVPIVVPNDQNIAIGPYYSGSPYLGNNDVLPTGTENFNQCGEYYHIAHNHALQQITGWGIVMGSQITFTRIDPPGGCPAL